MAHAGRHCAEVWTGILGGVFIPAKGQGCIRCPLSGQEPKVFGFDEVTGKRVMVWGQSPGRDEVEAIRAFVGRSGRFLWKELLRVGISREDCDVQNVMRCRPCSMEGGVVRDRDPLPEELRSCSVYNEVALQRNGGNAVLHIVLGKVAARQLLQGDYNPDMPFIWSKRLNAWAVCLDHPSYFLRGAPRERLEQFRRRLKMASRKLRKPGRWEEINAIKVKQATTRDIRALLSEAQQLQEYVAVDVEDERTDDGRRLLSIAFSLDGKTALVVPVGHPEATGKDETIRLVRKLLASRRVKKTMHYGAYDCDVIEQTLGVHVRGYDFDTQHAYYLTQPHRRAHGLEVIASQNYFEFVGWKELVAGNYSHLSSVDLKTLLRYNGLDAILTKRIQMDLSGAVPPALVALYAYAGRTLYRMESVGPCLDLQALSEIRPKISSELERITSRLKIIAQDPNFNPNSSQAVSRLIYGQLGYTPLGERARTDSDTISLLRQEKDHEALGLIIRHRELSKIKSTYLDNYEESARLNEGQVRTRWYLTGAVTGRLRSGGEGKKGRINLQNLHGSPQLQNLLVSDPSWRIVLDGSRKPSELSDVLVFLSLDYSQIEIRMLAECSGDKLLIDQFRQGLDIHCAVGHALDPRLSIDEIKRNKELRTFIKNCHFGMVYGLSADGLYHYLKTRGIKSSKREVETFMKRYFHRYKGVARFIDDARRKAATQGYVETIFGFKRYIGEQYDEERKSNPENQAVNSPIQGAAHTLVLQALALLSKRPSEYSVLGTPLMEIHDAIVWSVKLGDLREAVGKAMDLMEKHVPEEVERTFGIRLRVPLVCEASAGFRYGTQVPVDRDLEVSAFLSRWLSRYRELEVQCDQSYR